METNQAGEWGWLVAETGIPIAAALADLLASRAMCSVSAGAGERVARLCAQLAEDGNLTQEWWRQVLYAVPRHLFVPVRAFAVPGAENGKAPRVIDRGADPAGWVDAIYSDMTIITQRDDGAGDPASAQGLATCSLSAPGLAISFLELLDPQPAQRVLGIGTGTGWTAAVLSFIAGDPYVTSVEIDAGLLATARANLDGAGFKPALVIEGDGSAGIPSQVFDRLHVTCGVSRTGQLRAGRAQRNSGSWWPLMASTRGISDRRVWRGFGRNAHGSPGQSGARGSDDSLSRPTESHAQHCDQHSAFNPHSDLSLTITTSPNL